MSYPQVQSALNGLGTTRQRFYHHLRVLITAILTDYTISKNKKRWIDKTPNYFRYIEFIDELFSAQALYIIIARHPFDTAESLRQFSRRLLVSDSPDPELIRAAKRFGTGRYGWLKHWADVYDRLLAFSAGCEDRCIVIKYEDLVNDASPTLARVLEFIGESPCDDLIERAFSLPHDGGYGRYQDPTILTKTRIEKGSVGKWRAWPSSECRVLWPIVASLADSLGYSSPELGG